MKEKQTENHEDLVGSHSTIVRSLSMEDLRKIIKKDENEQIKRINKLVLECIQNQTDPLGR